MTSRFLELRPDNLDSDGTISFKQGFPVLSFTVQSQNAILDPRTIRVNGEVQFNKGLAAGLGVPVLEADGQSGITMDNRLGVFSLWDQLVVRHQKSQQIVEHIRHYNRYMSTYLGLSSSMQDMTGHLNQTCLIQPNSDSMFRNVVCSNVGTANGASRPNEFSCHLPSGFLKGGNTINLMETSFGGFRIEIHLTPDSNALFSRNGTINVANAEAHYVLKNLSLTCEVMDIPEDRMAEMSAQREGAMSFSTISSLYATFNTSNAQIQYDVGLKNLQSAFVTFCPSNHINTLSANGLATTYPAQQGAAGTLVHNTRVQFLKGGSKYPLDYDVTTNKTSALNGDIAVAGSAATFGTADPQLALQFAEAVIPEYMLARTSLSPINLNRTYFMQNAFGTDFYKQQRNGGALFGIGIRYSQFNSGQDFSQEQWGLSLSNSLVTDNPISLFIYYKAKTTVVFDGSGGIEVIQ